MADSAPTPTPLPSPVVDGVVIGTKTVPEVKPLQSLMNGFVKLRGNLTECREQKARRRRQRRALNMAENGP